VLVLRPGALGDTLLAVPALRALRAAWPRAAVTLAAQAAAARLLARVGEVAGGLPFDDPLLAWLWPDRPPANVAVPDCVVAWLTDADGRLQRRLHAAGVGRVVVAPARPAGDGRHAARHLVESLGPLGLVPAALDERPLAVAGVTPSDEVLVHPGSGARRKNWPAERFAATIARLRQADVAVRLIVGEADEEAAAAVERALGRGLPRLERPALERLAAALAGCRAYLGNDSGVSHLAGLVGARTLALFGPTPATVWRPLGPRVRVLPFDTPAAIVAAALRDGDGG
jgi:heptosyltransferase III